MRICDTKILTETAEGAAFWDMNLLVFCTFTRLWDETMATIFTVENKAEPGNGGIVLPDVQPGTKQLD
jgi:hypothetical protein